MPGGLEMHVGMQQTELALAFAFAMAIGQAVGVIVYQVAGGTQRGQVARVVVLRVLIEVGNG